MNKIAKASIATAAGVLLLLGGGGTFATWNDSATAGAGATITAGDLDVISSGTGTWRANGAVVTDIAKYAVSPGDVLTYTKPMTIIAKGDGMHGTIGLSAASITPATAGNPADIALAGFLTAGAELSVAGRGIVGHGATFAGAAGTAGIAQEITLTATITFPFADTDADPDNGDHNAAKKGAVSLKDFTVTLTQGTAPAPAPTTPAPAPAPAQ